MSTRWPSPLAGAVQAYCAGGLFDAARQLAGGNPGLTGYIEELYNRRLLEGGNAQELAARGQTQVRSAWRCCVLWR